MGLLLQASSVVCLIVRWGLNCLSGASQEGVTEIGSRVRFSASSVFLPNPEEAASFAPVCDELRGTIASFSDAGTSVKAYAVVEVVRTVSLVVPVDDLILVSGPEI
jgi:hypothetical protein